MKSRLILGVNGQDGILLSHLLISQGHHLIGIGAQPQLSEHVPKSVEYFSVDIRDSKKLYELIKASNIEIIYNLAGLSSVAQSFNEPKRTREINYVAVKNLLSKVYNEQSTSQIRFFQASSSEMFGVATQSSQNEQTLFNPISPYAESKVEAHLLCNSYQDQGFFVSCGILFNHESIFRPETFVTRKVTSAVARIKLGLQDKLTIGNLNATRDWGAARDYVDAINRVIEHTVADNFVIATGQSHSVHDLVNFALKTVGLETKFDELVETDKKLLRANDLPKTIGDARKALEALGWKSTTLFQDLISEMVNYDLEIIT
jgi:GDPmannose 4,6-dehydratase